MAGTKNISLPKRLSPGDTIGIVAPAGPWDRDSFDRGTCALENLGFKVFVPPALLDAKGYLAGPDRHRAEFINQLFADKRIDGIICARGGYGSLRILSLLDFQAIAENPKVFIGFSDITALLTAIADRSGLATFHGPVVTSLADAPPETAHSLLQAVSSDTAVDIKGFGGVTIGAGSASGVVCGGNLATLCHLVGTPFAPDLDNKILFLEDRAEPPYKIDRMLTQMKLAGHLDNLAGIALGSFEACGSIDDIYNIVAEAFRDESIPILAGLEVGHVKNNWTLPFGIPATMDADDHSLSYHRAATVAADDKGQTTDDRKLNSEVGMRRSEKRKAGG